jgi:membrane fusion protein, multidrug efflux system
MLRADNMWRGAHSYTWVVMFGLLMLLFAEQGCTNRTSSSERPSKTGMKGGAVSVVVSKAVQKDVPIDLRIVGTVEASSTVTVKSQISGELTRVFFREGDFVKKGDELFSIDARTYDAQLNQIQANVKKDEAALTQIEANLARDLAQQKYAQSEAARYSSLLEKRLVSKEQTEQVNASADAASAAVRADQAAIQSARATVEATKAAVADARVMLSYTNMRSPMDGRTGNLMIKQGNIISPSTELTTINQVEPIYITFSIPENQLRSVKQGQVVSVLPEAGFSPPDPGKLFFINNAVDPTTGTILAKAIFSNRDHKLWPGEYVQIVLRLGTKPNALIIPSQAVQTGQDGPFVFVVKSDQKVESRPVVPGMSLDGQVVIDKGIEAGEIVVTEGQLRLATGSTVQFRQN